MEIHHQLPTSDLLSLKKGDIISKGHLSGKISSISIEESDEFLLFLFHLENGLIEVKKLKQIC